LDEAIAQGADPEPVLLASGADFPDALAAAPLARTLGGVLVLVDPRDLTMSSPTRDFLTGRRGEISTILVAGGTTAVSPQVVLQVRDAIAD